MLDRRRHVERMSSSSSAASAVRRASALVAAAAVLILVLGAGSASSASRDQPRRDHDRGHWFEHTCAQAPQGFAACGAQVVTDAGGNPLASASTPAGYGPTQFHTAYGLPTTISTAGAKTIAIVDAYDDPNIASDLGAYDTQYGLPALGAYPASPWFRKVNQTGGASPPAGDSGWGLEISLDVETAHEICQNCNILLVEANSASYANLGAAENEAAGLGASVISNSYGGGDSSADTAYDSLYYNHPGVVVTASTGDSGYGVEYPASSPDVVAVGGTTLNLGADNSYGSETAWVDGGSGCSAYEAKPSWQHDTGCAHRTVADVSADADPNTGAAVYDTYGYGGWLQVGGTSLASPLVASVYALSGNTTNGSAPYSDPGGLNDVTSGSNGSCSPAYLCTAGAGYDGPTGLGTPKGTAAFAGGAVASDFSLSATPLSQTVTQGSGTSYTIAMTTSGGFADSVNLSATGYPSGAAVSFNPPALTGGSATLSVTTASTTPVGTYTLSVTGKDASSSLTHSIPVTLVVQAAAAPDFSLAISPSSQTLRTPGSASYTVTVNKLNGFAGSVTLAVSGLPSGFTSSFTLNPATTSSTLKITAPKSSRRTVTFTVTGTSGSLVHTKSATLSVR